jgi:MFS family permease
MADRWIALALIVLTRLSMGVQFQSLASVGPLVVEDLRLSYAELGTLVGLYLAPGIALALPGGLIGRRLGERRAVAWSLAVMVLGGLVTAASGGVATAALGRLLSGAGAVLLNVLLTKLTADWFAEREMATAMGVMLAAWPVGLGLAVSTLGGLAAMTSWRVALLAAAGTAMLGLVIMALVFREAPARAAPAADTALSPRELGLAAVSGLAWGTFNASLVAVVAFAPAMLVARGVSLAQAGVAASLAIWVTMVSVPLGGLLSDRLGRPNAAIVFGCGAAAALLFAVPAMPAPWLGLALVGAVLGAAAGPITSLLPRALPPARLAVGLGVSYTAYYLVVALAQPAAGLVRDVTGDPAAPIRFAAAVMAATVPGLVAFRALERAAVSCLSGRSRRP